MGKSTAVSIVNFFLKATRKHKNRFIKFPVNKEVREKIEEFKCLSKFPNVVGAIGGCHIEILAPEENPSDYFNRKQFYSVVLQGNVDANQKFLTYCYWFPRKHVR